MELIQPKSPLKLKKEFGLHQGLAEIGEVVKWQGYELESGATVARCRAATKS